MQIVTVSIAYYGVSGQAILNRIDQSASSALHRINRPETYHSLEAKRMALT